MVLVCTTLYGLVLQATEAGGGWVTEAPMVTIPNPFTSKTDPFNSGGLTPEQTVIKLHH